MIYSYIMKHKGFTLIELLVVISIVSLVSTVVVQNLSDTREKGRIASIQQFASTLNHSVGEGMVGEWKFDQDSLDDTSWYDAVSEERWSVAYGEGIVGRSLELNGTNECIRLDSSGLNVRDELTLSVWFKSNGTHDSSGTLVARQNNLHWNYNAYEIYVRESAGGTIRVALTDNTTGRVECDGSVNIQDGKWHHVAAVWDGSRITAAIDGVYDGAVNCAFSGPLMIASDTTSGVQNLWVGCTNSGWSHLGGSYDEVRVFDRALIAADISKIYAEGLSNHPILASN